ncbi:MAG: hypothetical protein JSV43_07315 [Methanobacteriota archaeon]|nr:MAG: hypothetical protein JSV43_07315 [Euryarchaeota archaeon]
MMLIVRLHPRFEVQKIWDFVQKEFRHYESEHVLPLWASQMENRNYISVLFETNDVDSITEFLIDEVSKCDEIAYTRTITLMKPAFFPVPRDMPENLRRFMIRVQVSPQAYHTVFDQLIRMKRPIDTYFGYAGYSFGYDDIRISAIVKDWETIRRFVRENITSLEGVKSESIDMICRSKRLTTRERWQEHQRKYSVGRLTGAPVKDGYEYDWTFIEECEVHGALPDEM